MTEQDAHTTLQEADDVIAALQAPVPDAKELLDKCLDAEIPAMLGRDDSCKTGGCSPKVQLFVREQDIARVANLLRGAWQDMLAQEGSLQNSQSLAPDPETGELPCPACGTAAPLEDGACTDCGLNLA